MDSYEPVNLPFPGRRTRKLARAVIVSALILLTFLSTFSHLLPAILALNQGGSLEGDSPYRIPPPLEDGPRVSLPPGTVSYGSRAAPSTSEVADSSVPPLLTSTTEAFVYQTSYGVYSFNRTSPFIFTLSSRSGVPLTKGSLFYVRASSSPLLSPRTSNVTVVTDNEFEVKYDVLLGNVTVGVMLLRVDFYTSAKPKFTAEFSKLPAWSLGDFNIVWSTITIPKWVKKMAPGENQSIPVNVDDLANGLKLAATSRVEIGPSEDSSIWHEWVTMDWSDVPGGTLEAGPSGLFPLSRTGLSIVFQSNQATLDPTQVATSDIDWSTAYSTQRKTFSYGDFYFLFWYDANNIVYSTSSDAVSWSAPFSTGSGKIGYNFDVFNSNSTIAIVWLKYDPAASGDHVTELLFRKGTIVGNSISWDPIRTVASLPTPYSYPPSIAIGSDGAFWTGGIWALSPGSLEYYVWIYRSTDGTSFSLSTNYHVPDETCTQRHREEALQLLPLAAGYLMALTSNYCEQGIRWRIWSPLSSTGPFWSSVYSQTIGFLWITTKIDLLSAVVAADGSVHLIFQYAYCSSQTNCTLLYRIEHRYYNSVANRWDGTGILNDGPVVRYPSLASDSLGNLHAFWMEESSGTPTTLWHRTMVRGSCCWSPRTTPFGSGSMITNARWLSAPRMVSKQLLLAWTLTGSSPNKVILGSIPLPSGVASAPPSEPWNKLGLSSNAPAGEYVSPGNGLLAIAQTDISVAGRGGITLSISRLYLQPFTFVQGNPFNYETSLYSDRRYADLGNGWQLDLPWVGPQYLHYFKGQLLPLVWTSCSGSTCTMEIHSGEDFVFSRTLEGGAYTYELKTKDGTSYKFNSWGLLTSVVDRTYQNTISFSYTCCPTRLATITDTIGRIATFNYDATPRLTSVTYGGQTVTYGYSGNNLSTVTDALGRSITLSYSPQNSWLVSGMLYPTGGSSSYTYGSVPIGTDALNYHVTLQNVYSGSLVRSSSFSYQITDGTVTYANVTSSDGVSVQGYNLHQFNLRSKSSTVTVLDAGRAQMRKTVSWYDSSGRVVQEDVYNGDTGSRGHYNSLFYDNWGNIIYTKDALGHESYASYANTDKQYMFYGPGTLTTTTEGRKFYDDFNGPALDSATWVQGGSAVGRTATTAFSLLTLRGSSSTQGVWATNWVGSAATFTYPFYAEVQMSLGANPGSDVRIAEFLLSPQGNGDPWTSDAIRLQLAQSTAGPDYKVWKNVGGVETQIYASGPISGGSLSVSWKMVLLSRDSVSVYLNKGSGYSWVCCSTALGLSTAFAPAYVYLAFDTTNTQTDSASFDYVSLFGSNTITVNGLQDGQKVELYDWNDVLKTSGTSSGGSGVTLDALQMVFPYGYLKIYDLDGRAVQFTSPTRDVWGGSTYSFAGPFKSGGLTRTTTGFLKSSALYVEDTTPLGATLASDGGDAWFWASQAQTPVASASKSHVGFSATGEHQHYFQGATSTISPASGQFHIQYVYIPSGAVPSEIMLQFHDNVLTNQLSNPGFETGTFSFWSQSGMILRSDYVHTGAYSAAPSYNPSTFTYSAFTLQQNLATPVSGGMITAIRFWYRWGTVADTAQVLYSDGTFTSNPITPSSSWTLKTLNFDSSKQVSGIKVVRSSGQGTNIVLDDFGVETGGWVHRAYWGSNMIPWGDDGTASRRLMGPMPGVRDTWLMLIVKTDDVGTNGLTIDGLAYTLYDGGVYWDYSAVGGPLTGSATFNGLVEGQKVEIYDSSLGLKVSGTVPAGGSSVNLDLYSAGVNVFPFKGYVKVYSVTGALQYSSPLMTDIWGGDVYTYNQPVFSNSFVFSSLDPSMPLGETIDSYDVANGNGGGVTRGVHPSSDSRYSARGQSFKPNSDYYLTQATFWLDKVGNPIGNIRARLYLGDNSNPGSAKPTGPVLESSENIVAMASLTGTPTATSFYFSGTYKLVANTVYSIVVEITDAIQLGASDHIRFLIDNNSPTHPGTEVAFLWSQWWVGDNAASVLDTVFTFKGIQAGGGNDGCRGGTGGGATIHNRPVGSAQYQNAGSVPQESYTRYDADGNLVEFTQTHNGMTLRTCYTYDVYGNVKTVINAKNQTIAYDYSSAYGQAYLTSTTSVNPSGNVTTTYIYDFPSGRMTAMIDPLQNRTDYEYDTIGRTTVVTYPAVNGITSSTLTTYQDSQNAVATRNEKGNYTRQVYDGLGRTITIERYSGDLSPPILMVERYTYDWQGKIKTYMAPDGNVTRYDYDYLGRLVKITNPYNTYRTISYDDLNLIESRYDENQHRTEYLYDKLQRLIEVREYYSIPSYYSTSYVYDEVGNLVTKTASNRQVLAFTPTEDTYVRSDQASSNFGTATTLQVDNSPVKHILIKFTITGVGTAQVTSAKLRLYNVDGSSGSSGGGNFYKTATSTWSENGTTWNNAPATQGSVIASLGSVSPNNWYTVDLTSAVTADGVLSIKVTSTSSDGADYTSRQGTLGFRPQLLVTTSARQVTTYSYDDLNRLVLTKYPDGFNETRTYDNMGNLASKTGPNGNTITYDYDSLNRLRTITYPDSSTATFDYDKNSNMISTSNSDSSATFSYDARDRLTRETWTISGTLYPLSYAYDAVGNLVGIAHPDSRLVSYAVDPLDRVTSVKTGSTTLATINYAPNGAVRTISYGNGVQTNFTYDKQARPSRIKIARGSNTLLDLNYGYDPAGNIATITGTNSETYNYDYLNRLTYSSGPWGTLQYGYDSVGNRQWFKQSSTNTTYTHGPYNRLIGVGSTLAYSYDNNGNLKIKTSGSTVYTYSYDFESHVTKVMQGSSTLGTYTYGPLGDRIKSVESGTTVTYINSGYDPLYEKNVSGSTTTINDYVYLGSIILAKLTGSSVYYFHQDHLGSTRLVTLGTNTSFSTNYQPFGTQYGASGTNPGYTYTGKLASGATGLHYHGARWYDQSVGGFISVDPKSGSQSNPQGLNPHAYALANPLRYVDPDGAAPVDVLGGLWETIGIASKAASSFVSKIHAEKFQQIQHGSTVIWDSTRYWTNGHTAVAGYRFETVPGRVRPEGRIISKLDLPGFGKGYSHAVIKNTHLPTPGAGEAVAAIYRYGSKINKALIVAGLAVSAWNIYNAYQADVASGSGYSNTIRAALIEAASWAGAYVGGYVGFIVGCMVLPGLGCIIGALVGSAIGAFYGDFLVTAATSPPGSIARDGCVGGRAVCGLTRG